MIFVSTATYALGKELGFELATEEFQRQIADPDPQSLPVARTIARLRALDDAADELAIYHDCSATSIGKSRSRAAHAARLSRADVWIACDDDVEATGETLRMLVDAVRGDCAICVAPCVTRGSTVVNVAFPRGLAGRELRGGGRVIPCTSGGFGLVAIARAALERLAERYGSSLEFVDDDGERKIALFLEALVPASSPWIHVPGASRQIWLGEDVAFCRRATDAGIRLEALVTGYTSHAGVTLRLDSVPALDELAPRGALA